MFKEDLEMLVWASSFHGGFLILLFLCLLLYSCSCWPRNHHKSVQLAAVVKSRIQAVMESRIEGLRAAVKKVILARLNDGIAKKRLYFLSHHYAIQRVAGVQ